MWQIESSARRVAVPSPVPDKCARAPDQTPGLSTFAVSVATINVLALDDPASQSQRRKARSGHTARIDMQCHEAGWSCVGLQETRTAAGRSSTAHYHVFASGCDTTHTAALGCELWIHRTRALVRTSSGTSVSADSFSFTVPHADPRRLCVVAQHQHFALVLVVLHAPCLLTTTTVDDLGDWWLTTADLCTQWLTSPFALVFLDANAAVSRSAEGIAGSLNLEPHSDQADLFAGFVERCGLAIPSTFPSLHRGPSFTWTHARGTRLRRDYVLVPQDLLPTVSDSFVVTDWDNGFAHEDHLPAVLSLGALVCPLASARRVRWDSAAFLDPSKVSAFQRALDALPVPTWDVPVSSHCRLHDSQVLALAQQFFGAVPGVRPHRHGVLSEATRNLIAFKRQVLDFSRGCPGDPLVVQVLRDLEGQLRPLVAADQRAYFDQVLQGIEDAGAQHDFKTVFKQLNRLCPKRKRAGGHASVSRPLPMLRKPDGTTATTMEEQQKIWLHQFAQVEAGLVLSFDALQAMDAAGFGVPMADFDFAVIPSEWEIHQKIKGLKRGKAAGTNSIPPDVYKAGAAPMARHLCALTTKAAVHAHEPLSWKGGRLVPLWKATHSPTDPAAYRSIFVSDYSAKIYHQCVRQQLVTVWERSITGLQYGGRRGHGVDMAHHVLQAHGFWAKSQHSPAGVLFVDLKSAFYSVLRQGLHDGADLDNALVYFLAQHGVHPDQIAQIAHDLRVASADNATEGISAHTARVLQDLLFNTHFWVDHLPTPVRTARGTRPGDPIGDLLFNMLMSLILADARRSIMQAADAPWLGQAGPAPFPAEAISLGPIGFLDVAFVDDAAILCHAPSNEAVLDLIQSAVAFRVIFLLYVAGPGSMAFKQSLVDCHHRAQWSHSGIDYSLRLVMQYKHLGTWMQAGMVHGREVVARTAALRSSWGPLVRTLYARPQIALHRKVALFRSLSLSRYTYNVHVWVGVTEREWNRWTAACRVPLTSLVRARFGKRVAFDLSVDTLAGLVGLPAPMDLVHVARLRYWSRLLRVCPPVLWSWMLRTVGSSLSWLDVLRKSFEWLLHFYPYPLPVAADAPISEWASFVNLDSSWSGRLKTALDAASGWRRSQAEAKVWNSRFDQAVVRCGGVLPDEPVPPASLPWECELCGQAFSGKAALAMHSTKVHGYRNVARYFATDGRCAACARDFSTRPRLRQHLTAAPSCLPTLRACFAPLDAAEVDELDAKDSADAAALKQAGWHATKALVPRIKTYGPCLPPPGSDEAELMRGRSLRRRAQVTPGFHLLAGRQVGSEDAPLPNEVIRVGQVDLPPFVMHSAGGWNRADGRMDSGGLAREYARCHFKHVVIAHFFSGFRRDNDLHCVVEHSAVVRGVCVMTLSVDMCMQKTVATADLSRFSSTTWWLDRIRSGQLIAAGGGPPCETYTAARLLDNGPRALRSRMCPYGLPFLTKKEWKQVQIGTILVNFLLEVILMLAWTGGCGWLEHPQWPVWAARKDPLSVGVESY
eukprot:Skav235412  [mRNA]  locus=scaffold924:32291:36799:- [translate_table: standard]